MTKSGKFPEEYFDYALCKMYSCTPSELDELDADTVELHMSFLGLERRMERIKVRRAQQAAKVNQMNNG